MPDPCIRCTQCESVCPVDLKPQFLLASIQNQNWQEVEKLKFDHCLICQACTVACPAEIPLQTLFKEAVPLQQAHRLKQEKSLVARARYEAREKRLERKQALQSSAKLAQIDKRAAISAALARAQWKFEDA